MIDNPLVFPKDYQRAGVCQNGAIHCAHENSNGLCEITVFDLVEDMFKTLPPLDSVLSGNCQYSLRVVNDYLCLATETGDDRDTQFWVMMEYNMETYWTSIRIPRQFRIDVLGCEKWRSEESTA
ncbi:hypothetical protein Dsin_005032 [Dipteronia sinensis]|uniref:F-box associated domain-containing protein n=1 Tax=Dipteronia sinensis TaxID=43782 RepID=A0AAE0AWL4_9ROSI|nr:hypothetical protein Dsin_005032 [Dipteronia sinensis]